MDIQPDTERKGQNKMRNTNRQATAERRKRLGQAIVKTAKDAGTFPILLKSIGSVAETVNVPQVDAYNDVKAFQRNGSLTSTKDSWYIHDSEKLTS